MNWRRIAGLFTRRREDAALCEELEFHRAHLQADLEADGMPSAEARQASHRAMGNITLAREDVRAVWVARWADQLLLDARCGTRNLLRQPLVAIGALLATALGVATTTTVFSIADSELWKPLPFSRPEQLVAIVSRGPSERASNDGLSGADLLDWRGAVQAFSDITLSGRTTRQALQRQTAESVLVTEVTANYFAVLGRPIITGRVFSPSDGLGERHLVITDRAWRRVFGGDPAAVGRSVILDEVPAVVVGVVKANDSLWPDSEFFLALDERSPGFLDRANHLGHSAIGRLRPGVNTERAQAELQGIAADVAKSHPAGRKDHRIHIEALDEYTAGAHALPVYFFLGASLVVLLLSTVNVAALLLSRAIGRGPEFALRRALGGGQAALARQLFVEGLLLATVGGALGVLFATWAVQALAPLMPGDVLRRGTEIPIDLRVVAFSLAATGLATIMFGLAPLPLARRAGATTAMRSGTRAGRPAAEGRGRSILLAIQVALTVVLLAGAGLFFKSFTALTQVPLGFEPDNLSAVRVSLSGPRYASDESIRAYAGRLRETTAGFPGLQATTIATSAPLGSGPIGLVVRADQPRPAPGDEARAILRAVDAEYFRTLGISVMRGRGVSADDGPGAPRVAVINATLAKRLFGDDEDPLGQVIELLPGRATWANRSGPLTVVGIAANIKEVGINEIEFGDVYVPFAHMPAPQFELIARSGGPIDLTALRAIAATVDPLLPIGSAATFEQRVDTVLAADAFNLYAVAAFAAIAIVLSAIGIYAAAAYHVQSRTQEFGIRLALGGTPATLVGGAIWQAGRPALVGGALGVVAMLVLARLLGNSLYLVPGSHNGILFGVTLTDPAVLAAVFIGLQMVAVVAAGVPARQVTRLDPMRALSE